MTSRVLLILGVLVFVAGFLTPVTAEGYGSCGLAGTGFPYLGDPSGPQDHPEMYAEYVACGRASALPHLVMSCGLLLVLAGAVAALMRQLRDPGW